MRRVRLAAIALASLGQAVCAKPADDAVARFKSCLQLGGAARGECLEKLSQELSGANAPAPAPAPWVISETTSPVDYSPQITAVLASKSVVKDGATSEECFKAWGRSYQRPTQLFYSGYPELSVANINNNTWLRHALHADAIDDVAAWRRRLT